MQGTSRLVLLAVAEGSGLANEVAVRCPGIGKTHFHYTLQCLEDFGLIQKQKNDGVARDDARKQWPGFVWSLTEEGEHQVAQLGESDHGA